MHRQRWQRLHRVPVRWSNQKQKDARDNRSKQRTLQPVDEERDEVAAFEKIERNQHNIVVRNEYWENTLRERPAVTVEYTAIIEQNQET